MNTTYNLKREQLEKEALATVSSDLYWDLANMIDDTPDEELRRIIACGGDYGQELAGTTPELLSTVVADIFKPALDSLAALKKVLTCAHDMEELDALRSRCRKNCGLEVNIQDVVAEGHYDCNLDATHETVREMGGAYCQDHEVVVQI